MLINPTLKRGAICCRRIRGESHWAVVCHRVVERGTVVASRTVVADEMVVAGLLTEPLVPTGKVSIAN